MRRQFVIYELESHRISENLCFIKIIICSIKFFIGNLLSTRYSYHEYDIIVVRENSIFEVL